MCVDQIFAAGKLFEELIEDILGLLFLSRLQIGFAEEKVGFIPVVVIRVIGQCFFQAVDCCLVMLPFQVEAADINFRLGKAVPTALNQVTSFLCLGIVRKTVQQFVEYLQGVTGTGLVRSAERIC